MHSETFPTSILILLLLTDLELCCLYVLGLVWVLFAFTLWFCAACSDSFLIHPLTFRGLAVVDVVIVDNKFTFWKQFFCPNFDEVLSLFCRENSGGLRNLKRLKFVHFLLLTLLKSYICFVVKTLKHFEKTKQSNCQHSSERLKHAKKV